MAYGEAVAWQTESEAELTPNTVEWNGCQLINASAADTVRWLADTLAEGERKRLSFTSAHTLHLAQHDPYLATALRRMDALLPDGSGVAVAERMTGHRFMVNLNPRDLIPALLRALPSATTFFQLGSRPEVTERVAINLKETWPHLRLVGCQDSSFDLWESASLVERINTRKAQVVMVGMDAPRQQLWMDRYAHHLEANLVIGVGSLFDFAANHTFDHRREAGRLSSKGAWRLQVGGPVFQRNAAL
ncbi:MAG: WecB/TagA/CpsF family glycosyltransferase [Pseudomonadota bacterium]